MFCLNSLIAKVTINMVQSAETNYGLLEQVEGVVALKDFDKHQHKMC